MIRYNFESFRLISVIIVLLFALIELVSYGHAGTVYYVHDSRPDDSGNGLSWATAKQTLTAFSGMLSAGDTVVAKGAWGTFNIDGADYPNGTSSDYVVFIDSLRYTNGYNEAYPDTVYGARIYSFTDSGLILNHSYYKFLGWSFWSQANTKAGIDIGADGDYVVIQNCYAIQEYPRSYGVRFNVGSKNSKIISCLVLSDRGFGIWIGDDDTYIYNCTIIKFGGDNSNTQYSGIFTNSTAYPPVFVSNNMVIITVEHYDGHKFVNFHSQASTTQFDYNLYHAPEKTGSYFLYYTTVCDDIESWRTALSVEYAEAETHSVMSDPLFLETSHYAIDETSPAYEAGYDLGYGTNVGYYQGIAPLEEEEAATIIRKRGVIIW